MSNENLRLARQVKNNAIASARMEGFDFTDEQLNDLADIIEQVDDGKMTWQGAIGSLVEKYRRND